MKLVALRFFLSLLFLIAGKAQAFPQFGSGPNPAACLSCHGNQAASGFGKIRPPTWPDRFQMDWSMYEVEGNVPPPYEKITTPKAILKGKTYYDWPARKMMEVYEDRCISIFPTGKNFSCKFVSDHEKTYLITFPLGDLAKPKSCCRWTSGEFWAPRPDVLERFAFQKQTCDANERTNWWLFDIPLPGPFGYGTDDSSGRPQAFWFPVIDAWVQQEFNHFSTQPPDPSVFDLPSECGAGVKTCDEAPQIQVGSETKCVPGKFLCNGLCYPYWSQSPCG